QVARTYLWEISELNFRLEFIALDKRLHVSQSSNTDSRKQLVYSCFPGWTTAGFSLFDCDLRYANRGLAARDWREKLPFLLRLNTVMKSWLDYEACNIRIVEKYDEQRTADLELELATFYTQSFFESLGRPATVP
ncbi:hypothetical protein DFH06DRAFT_948030, partial [Mycena polygramma]